MKNMNNANRKKMNSILENILSFLFMGVSAFFFTVQSPIHIWNYAETGIDSSVFKTVSMLMQQGFMPYRDTFDHTGPLLYIINWIGDRISWYRGVWVLELLFLTVGFFMIYKTARLVCRKGSSFVVTFASISLLFGYYNEGNCAEEYALPFIALSTWIFIDYFFNEKINWFRLMLCGLCFAGTLLLRPNMICLWIVFCIAVLLKCILHKRWKIISLFALWFLAGMCILMVPILIWLGVNRTLGLFWDNYILFNLQYTAEMAGESLFSAKWYAAFTFINTTVFLLSITALIYMSRSRNRFLNLTYLIYMVISLVFIGISGMTYPHYGMVLVPVVSYPLAIIFGAVEEDQLHISGIVSILVSIYLLAMIILPQWMNLIAAVPAFFENKDAYHISDTVRTVVSLVEDLTAEEETITVYGNWNLIYVLSHRIPASRYSYQVPIGDVNPQIIQDYMQDIKEQLPAVAVIQAEHYDERISSFLSEENYKLAWSEYGENMDGALVFIRSEK